MSRIKSVAVIGAGPGGLAAAKYLVSEQAFSRIVVFDARPSVGGTWCATPHNALDPSFTIPRTEPSKNPTGSVRFNDRPEIISPVYDMLDTNIPHTLMNYSDLEFPLGSPLFPSHQTVRKYLEKYSEEIAYLLCLGTQILEVVPIGGEGARWSVRSMSMETRKEAEEIFDAVVVASGHYDDPFIPNISGISAWNTAFPGSVSHSKYYRRPSAFKDKKVVIVGHSASGIDLANQISAVSRRPLIISKKTTSSFSDPDGLNISLPEISEFFLENRSIRFTNGHVERNVDSVVFCTGYMYSYPFLKTLSPPVVDDGSRVLNLYQQIFYHPRPTLSFIGLPQRIVPLPVSESQSAVISRVLSGRLSLPTKVEMQDWEAELVARTGGGKNYHDLKFPSDANYINELYNWSMSAPLKECLSVNGVGKVPPYWGEEKQWVRARFPMIKEASRKLGNKRHHITTLKELGFDFNYWQATVDAVEREAKL